VAAVGVSGSVTFASDVAGLAGGSAGREQDTTSREPRTITVRTF
jgi:hypothetical protein